MPGDVALLEGVGADQVVRTWPVMQTSGVESIHASAIGVTRFVAPGPEVAKATPTRPGRARVALGHVTGALLVAREHVADGRAASDRVVERQDRAAREPEDDVDALGLEGAEDRVGAVHPYHSRPPARTRRSRT